MSHVEKKNLFLNLHNLSIDLFKKYKIKNKIK